MPVERQDLQSRFPLARLRFVKGLDVFPELLTLPLKSLNGLQIPTGKAFALFPGDLQDKGQLLGTWVEPFGVLHGVTPFSARATHPSFNSLKTRRAKARI